MRRVFEILARLAESDITVLISGESGTGKDLAAQAIHEASARARGPFQVVDCGSLPPTLIESELYGHKRGAFTGALTDRQGAFAAARGGTLFLDEIGELPLALQPRLLGAIERRQIQPLGSSESIPIDVRIIAATNRDLRREINRRTFREDLFFRLAVGLVEMPPLRDHLQDIPLYVDALCDGDVKLDAEAIKRLGEQSWPGNVRELRNALERAQAVRDLPEMPSAAESPPSPVEALTMPIDSSVPYKTLKALLVDQYDQLYLKGLMARHRGNITHAARHAELDRVYLLRLLDRFGLRPRR